MKGCSNDCSRFRLLVDTFISIRTPAYLSQSELATIIAVVQPCISCVPNPGDLSPLSGRLYKTVWDNLPAQRERAVAKCVDMFGGTYEP